MTALSALTLDTPIDFVFSPRLNKNNPKFDLLYSRVVLVSECPPSRSLIRLCIKPAFFKILASPPQSVEQSRCIAMKSRVLWRDKKVLNPPPYSGGL